MIEVSDATIFGNTLMIKCPMSQAEKFVEDFNNGKVTKLKPMREKRSNDANAYAWVLLDKIAVKIHRPVIEIYKDQIRNLGGVSEWICCKADKAEKVKEDFIGNHIGRQVEQSPSKVPGCVNLKLYIGSSDYDTEQMSRFIDNIIQECEALDIETEPEDYVNALLEAWDEKRVRGRT